MIVYAKDRKVKKKIVDQFKRGQVQKRYFALVKGKLKRNKGIFSGEIIDKYGKRFGEKAKPAKTFYRVIKNLGRFSLVDLKPITGRTNQLRIQLAQAGHPILGERIYAFGRDFQVKFGRLALHAAFLSFIHPVSKERVSVEIGLPEDMKTFLQTQMSADKERR